MRYAYAFLSLLPTPAFAQGTLKPAQALVNQFVLMGGAGLWLLSVILFGTALTVVLVHLRSAEQLQTQSPEFFRGIGIASTVGLLAALLPLLWLQGPVVQLAGQLKRLPVHLIWQDIATVFYLPPLVALAAFTLAGLSANLYHRRQAA